MSLPLATRIPLSAPRSPFHKPCNLSWACLAEHLVRLDEVRRRDGEVEGLGRLEVDDQLELRGLLHWQVGGLGAFQDLVYVERGTAQEVGIACPIGPQVRHRIGS